MQWLAGCLLVCAAMLKALDLLSEQTSDGGYAGSHFLFAVQIGFELGIGLLLLSGLFWRNLRLVVVILFTGFACYSLYMALHGATYCRCFGPVHIHPWWTFGLDCVLAISPVILWTRGSPDSPSVTTPLKRGLLVAIAFGMSLIPIYVLLRDPARLNSTAKQNAAHSRELMVLQPEQWIGQKLPIAKSIDVDVSGGKWVVLLHRHDCPVCQRIVTRYEQRSISTEQIALIEVPPYGIAQVQKLGQTCHFGRLTDDLEWFVRTPVEIRVQGGIVTAVQTFDN